MENHLVYYEIDGKTSDKSRDYRLYLRKETKMKRLVIELDDAMHKEIKMEAIKRDTSAKQYVTELIKKDLEAKEKE